MALHRTSRAWYHSDYYEKVVLERSNQNRVVDEGLGLEVLVARRQFVCGVGSNG